MITTREEVHIAVLGGNGETGRACMCLAGVLETPSGWVASRLCVDACGGGKDVEVSYDKYF